MFARATNVAGRSARAPLQQQSRGFASEKQMKLRIRSIKNTKKITSAMKMVAACKLRVTQEGLERHREYVKDIDGIWKVEAAEKVENRLYVGVSADRGLCGGVNSSIVRAIRDGSNASEKAPKILLIGDKAKQGLERMYKDQFVATFSDIMKAKVCTNKQLGDFVDAWFATPHDQASLIFNKFKSMIAYVTTEQKFDSWDSVKDKANAEFAGYSLEGDSDILQNLYEYRAAAKLTCAITENETATLSARMQAMDSSTKNASDMIDKLSLVLNRTRQARITTELTEIISGAAAIE